MAHKTDYSTYGSRVPPQPGGPNATPMPRRSECSGSPRLGPAKPGGNSPRKLNPYVNKGK